MKISAAKDPAYVCQLIQHYDRPSLKSLCRVLWLTFNVALWGFREALTGPRYLTARRITTGLLVISVTTMMWSMLSTNHRVLVILARYSQLSIPLVAIYSWAIFNVVLYVLKERLYGTPWMGIPCKLMEWILLYWAGVWYSLVAGAYNRFGDEILQQFKRDEARIQGIKDTELLIIV